jgi:hypothetical protein
MGATLALGGVNPLTGERVVHEEDAVADLALRTDENGESGSRPGRQLHSCAGGALQQPAKPMSGTPPAEAA